MNRLPAGWTGSNGGWPERLTTAELWVPGMENNQVRRFGI
jgi:hypothetical protein